MTNVKYSIERHNNIDGNEKSEYILWKTIESNHGFCTKNIFHGSKKECEDKLKEIKDDKDTQ